MAEKGVEERTQLQITNISPDVSDFFLGLYLEKILQCDEVEVTHSQGNSVATVTVLGPGIDIQAAQLAADTEPLSNQRVTISVLEEDGGLERRGRRWYSHSTADYRESSLWSLPWTSASLGTNVNDGVADSGDICKSSTVAEPIEITTEKTSPKKAVGGTSPALSVENLAGEVSLLEKAIAPDSSIPKEINAKASETAPAKLELEKKASSEETHSQREIVPIPPEKWKLALFHLKKKMKNDNTFKVHVDEEKCAVTVDDVKEKLELYEILSTIVEAPMPRISPQLGRVLSSKKGERSLEDKNVHGTICVRDDEVFLVTDSEVEEGILRRLIGERKHNFFDVHEAFLKSKEWGHFKTQLSEKHLVDFIVNFEQRAIVLSGINIDQAGRELDEELARNAQTKESMTVESTVGRYLTKFGQHHLKTVEDKWTVKIAVKETKSNKSSEVEISGHVSSVKTAKEEMKKFIASLHKDTTERAVAGIRPLFRSEHGQTFLSGLETKETCTIEVEDGKPSKEPFIISTQEARDSTLESIPSVRGRTSRERRNDKDDASVRPKQKEETLSQDHLLFTQGSVSLSLAQGDVTGYKADVLVNTLVADCKSFAKGGAVAKSFLRKGGKKLEQEYFGRGEEKRRQKDNLLDEGEQESSRSEGEVVHTAAYEELKNLCSHVLHLKVRRWDRRTEPSPSQMKLQAHIEDCLRRCAQEYKVKSIAFPTVGCGRFGYPVDKVAKAFEDALKQFAGDGHAMKVTLVAYDRAIYKQVLNYFEPGELSVEEEEEEYEDDDGAIGGGAVAFLGTHYVPAFASTIFRVCGASRQSVQNAIANIVKHASDALSEDQIESSEPLSPSILRHLEKLNTDEVAVTVDQDRGVVRFAGVSQRLISCRRSIATILERGAYENLPEEKQKLLQMALMKFSVPKYWSKKSQKSPQTPRACLVDVSKQVRHAVETLVSKTWRGDVVGIGADAKGLKHSTIKIKNVQRVENPDIWREYDDKRKQFLTEAAFGSRPFPDIASLDGKQDVCTRGFNLPELDELVEPAINEVLLFHGTKEDILQAITKQGLDFRMGGKGYFGKGLYFAESSTKADQYADSKHERTEGKHHMLLARVLLGTPWVCHKPGGGRQRPPCMKCEKSDCMDHQQFYNSVIGVGRHDGTELLFREFIVFDKGVSYPEFCITYERK